MPDSNERKAVIFDWPTMLEALGESDYEWPELKQEIVTLSKANLHHGYVVHINALLQDRGDGTWNAWAYMAPFNGSNEIILSRQLIRPTKEHDYEWTSREGFCHRTGRLGRGGRHRYL